MTYQRSVGEQLKSYLGDISGVSDVVDEWQTGHKDGDMSLGDWAKTAWQGGQVLTESLFIAPFKVAFKGFDEWSEEVVEPGLAWLALMDPGSSAQWKQSGESYGEYLRRVNAVTWGASERDDPTRVTVGDVAGANWSRNLGRDLDPMDPVQRRKIREDPFTGKVAGFSDFAIPAVADPLNFIGAPAKAVSAAGRGARLVSEGTYESAGFVARRGLISPQQFAQAIDDGRYAEAVEFIGRTEDDIAGYSAWAANSRLGINDPASFAHLANTVKGEEDAALLLKTLVGDADAGTLLKDKYGPGYDLLVKNALGDDRAWQHAASSGDEIVFDPDLIAGIDELVTANDTSEVGQRIIRESQEAFARGVDQLTADPTRTNITRVLPDESTWLGRREARGQQKRAERLSAGMDRRTGEFADEIDEAGNTVRTAVLTPYRPTALHPAQWFLERPSGLVQVENPDSINEILAQIREIDRVTDGAMSAKGYGNWVIDEWTKASTHASPQTARGLVAHKVNQLGISLLAEKHGLTPAQAEALFKMGTEKAQRALKLFREKGWLGLALDDGSMGILRSPLLQRATPNSVQMWDIAHLDKYFTRMQSTGFQKVWRVAADGTVGGLDMINSAFKISVLFRLGYTMRNLTEAAWSLAATGNLGHVMSAVGEERIRTLFNPARKTGARLIERIGTATGRMEDRAVQRASYEEKQAMLEALDKIRADQIRRLSHIDVKALVMSGDEEQYRLARRVLEMRARLGAEETTWHATNDPDWALDPERYLSTTGSQVMALREADKVWHDYEVAAYSPTGTREGLLSPHPEVGRGAYGNRAEQVHGTPTRWEGDHPDPELRGEVLFDWFLQKRTGLVGRGLYTTNSRGVASSYRRGATFAGPRSALLGQLGQTYTTIWRHFRAPKILDADQSIRDIPELVQFGEDFVDDLAWLMDRISPPPNNPDFPTWAEFLQDRVDNSFRANEMMANPGLPEAVRNAMGRVESAVRDPEYWGPDYGIRAVQDALDDGSVVSPRQRLLLNRMLGWMKSAQKTGVDIDDADLGMWMDEMAASDQLAYNWFAGHSPVTAHMGEALQYSLLDKVAQDPQILMDADVQKFLHKYFSFPGESTEILTGDFWDSPAGGLLERINQASSGRYGEDAAVLISDAMTKAVRGAGYDAIKHTGGGWVGGSGSHGVVVFLNGEDIRVVGEDWLDYDNEKVLAAARGLIADLYQQMQNGARVRRVNFDRRADTRGVVASDLPGAVEYREVTQADLDNWMDDPTLMAREFGYDPKKPVADANFKRMFQVLDADAVADAKPVTTYGRTLDMSISDWRRLPADIVKAMRWKHHLQGPEKGFGANDRVLPGDDLVAAFGEDFKDVHWVPWSDLLGLQGNRMGRTQLTSGDQVGLRYNPTALGNAIRREGFDRNYMVVEYNPANGAMRLGEGNHRLAAVIMGLQAGKKMPEHMPVKFVVNKYLDAADGFIPAPKGVGSFVKPNGFTETKEILSREDIQAILPGIEFAPPRTPRKPKRTKARSYTADMRAVRDGDQATRDEIMGIANALGYDRVVFPDKDAFGGRQVLVNPKYVGPEGLTRRVDEEIRKIEQQVQVPTEYAPERRTGKARRAERKAYRANGNPNPSAVIPDFERRLAATMENNGIEAWVEDLLTTRHRLESEADQIAARLSQAEARQARREGAGRPGFGQADVSIRSKFGEDYSVAGPLGGHAGSLWARMTSSDDTNKNIFLPSDRGAAVGGTPAPTTVAPNDPQYFEAWSNILNLHFRDPESNIVDPVVEMFLKGHSVERVIKWATTTREGYDWANSIGLTKSSTATLSGRGSTQARAEALAEARQKVESGGRNIDPETIEEAVTALDMATRLYLPDGPVRDAFVNGTEVTPGLISRAREGMENSAIHGLLLQTGKEAQYNRAWTDYAKEGVSKSMRVLGSIPETSVMRHPFFATMARDEYQRRIALAEERVGRRLTVKEINQIIHDSRNQAKRDLEKTLYTIVRRSGFAENTRFLFPFAAAWENTMRRWGSFVKDDPSLPVRAGLLVTKTMNTLPLFDAEGNEIDAGDMTADSYVMLPGLDSLGKFVGGSWGQMLQSQAQDVQVPLRSLDLITQGEPGNPGFGPFMLMPIAAILKRKPTFDEFLGWTMPYGAPAASLDVFMPTWVRRVKSMYTKDSTYTNAFTSAYLYEMWRYEQGMREDEPTMAEVEKTTKSFYLLRTLTNLTAPFSVKYSNERDWYVAKLRQYRTAHEDQREAEARFFADFPDAARLVQSLSSNPAGVLATDKAYGNLSKYKQEVAEAYGMGDPSLAGFVANYGNDPQTDDFSGAVYSWERNTAPVPGSMDTFRRVANPEEAVRESRVEEGWRQWRSVVEQTEARLNAAGVPVDSPGYEQVMTNAKRLAAEAVYATGNEAWWLEYKDPDTSKYYRRASFFENLVSNSQFMADHGDEPLMRSISLYLSMRRRYAEAVQLSALQGGPRSLTGDLGRQWQATVAQMKADSPEFAAWVDRYMQNDPVVGGEPIRRAA